ncbi:MAG: sulfurtransferase [Bradyrhizobium sp.]|uniref:chromate resistance protein ChrB domain-containing protein n=1 Tax=Bradyrhizobium sp. TaxID=376 RepID=UPI00120DBCD7|nr:chromate resistance protein ChrB domain-containing protein [Bradyrhizobium sp.]THD62146.1 MAG: sulfurtransferase [Bradyrhizobium sp.]
MPSPTEISVAQLSRIIGLPGAPVLVDVRPHDDGGSVLPAARRMEAQTVSAWGHNFSGRRVIVYCRDGGATGEGTAAWLRQAGIDAQTLEGGFEAWREAGQPLLCVDRLPERDAAGRTTWVTRARPKIIRIACPWLIRRFIDPAAVFLYVAPSEVTAVAERFKATPFDSGDGIWNDRADACTFDVMLEEFNLKTRPLSRLAAIIRGADTGKPDLTLQSGGLLAISLGYSRMFREDVAQLDATLPVYDALYRWCRDGTEETHG